MSNQRVHSVLDLQHDMVDVVVQETFEHASAVVCLVGIVRECGCRQLLLIADKNDTLGHVLKWDQIVEFDTLTRLIDY